MTTVAPNLCQKCFTVTFNHTKCSENGTYAILLIGSGDGTARVPDDVFSNCQSDGGDICMSTDAAGANQIAIEIVSISTSGKNLELWFPGTINTSTDVTFTVWYKSISGTLAQPAASATFGSQAVWSSDYVLVSHDGGLTDSTSNGNNGTNHGSTSTSGKIGTARAFASGSSQYIDCGRIAALENINKASISCWYNRTTDMAVGKFDSGSNNTFGLMYAESGSGFNWNMGIKSAAGGFGRFALQSGLRHAAMSLDLTKSTDAAKLLAFDNGSQQTLTFPTPLSGAVTNCTGNFQVGRGYDTVWFYSTATLDEVRAKTVADSANRVLTDYNIQSSTSLITVGSVLFSPPFYDATSTSGYQPSASTYNVTHVCSTLGSRYIVASVSLLSTAGATVSGITYNGVAMTNIGIETDATNVFRVEMWGLVAPATGSNTVAVTLNTSISSVTNVSSWTNVHQTTPYEGFNGATAFTGLMALDATVNCTTVAAQALVISGVTTNDTSITAGTGTTAKQNVTGAAGSAGLGIQVPTVSASTVVPDWTNIGSSSIWSIAAVALRPVSASSLGYAGLPPASPVFNKVPNIISSFF